MSDKEYRLIIELSAIARKSEPPIYGLPVPMKLKCREDDIEVKYTPLNGNIKNNYFCLTESNFNPITDNYDRIT